MTNNIAELRRLDAEIKAEQRISRAKAEAAWGTIACKECFTVTINFQYCDTCLERQA